MWLDGKAISDPAQPVAAGGLLELRMGVPKKRPKPALAPEAIVYFDEDVVVANKPAGMMTVPHRSSEESETLDRLVAAALRQLDPRAKRASAALGVVHRIDKETSGLVVFARTFAARQRLSEQFRQHALERRYLALTQGHMESCVLRSRLLRDKGEGRRGSAAPGSVNAAGEALGRPAVTRVELLERLPQASLVACRLETGRTHQIRIHLSEAGHPILGERVYAGAGQGLPAPRVMLHAADLGFIHPRSGQQVRWTQPLPPDFARLLKRLRG